MVQVIFFYEVSEERQQAYLEETAKTIKPFWESNGCDLYSVWKVDGSQTAFVKEMIFEDEATMKRTLSLEAAEPIKELFYDFAKDVSRKICTQKI